MFEKSLKDKFDKMLPITKKKFPSIIRDILKRAKEIDENGFSEEDFDKIKSVLNDANKVFDLDKKLRDILP